MNLTQMQFDAEEFKIMFLFEQLASLIAKKSRLHKVMFLVEGKVKEQARCLFEQFNLKTMEASDPNTNIVLSKLLEDFQVLSSFAGSSTTALEAPSNSKDSF